MKTQYSVGLTQAPSLYIKEFARTEYISLSEAIRQIMTLGINTHQEQEVPISEQVQLLEDQMRTIDEQKRQLSYQRDFLKDRIEDQ